MEVIKKNHKEVHSESQKSLHAKKIESILGPRPEKNALYIPEGFRRKNVPMHEDHIYKLKALAFWMGIPEYEANYAVYQYYLEHNKIKDMPERQTILLRNKKGK